MPSERAPDMQSCMQYAHGHEHGHGRGQGRSLAHEQRPKDCSSGRGKVYINLPLKLADPVARGASR